MENSQERVNGNGVAENGHHIMRNTPYQPAIKVSLPWLDLRVFYVRVSKCEVDDSTPEYLTLNHIPLNHDTLLEVNGVRTSMYSDGSSTFLRRNRLDKKSEEVTFVSTDSTRMTGSVKFDVFDKDALMLSGVIELCTSNGFAGESENHGNHGQRWSMNCESDILAGTSFLNGKQYRGMESASPEIEVYVAGSFSGYPIVLTKTLQLNYRKKQIRNGMLESIPECEATESPKEIPPRLNLLAADYPGYKPEHEGYNNPYSGMEYLEGEDGELSWFNAGVRVGVGIGLSICLGIGIGAGLLVRTYQGTTRNFRRRLL
ncbi:hypothetical protein RJ639_041736 [Escallonia herrerae]|uniref:Erythronate-4-phosphate dehydrogenase family protein n=1 Tax=Escallonia herrerae TaxID=1293975 RepID=A0AA88WSY5_9ASTE|nr:hypothetical protein RJ639_041736 [Escallonia herrerae]